MAPADDIYVINGFYSSMRRKYTAPGASVYYFSVEWDSSLMSWAEFRGEVLGATDPERASVGSMRWQIMQDWAALGLVAKPDVGDNGVHGSASPFEALVERLNWLGASLDTDETARAIVSAGVSRDRIGERSARRPLRRRCSPTRPCDPLPPPPPSRRCGGARLAAAKPRSAATARHAPEPCPRPLCPCTASFVRDKSHWSGGRPRAPSGGAEMGRARGWA